MKMSVSLADADAELVDAVAREEGVGRSRVVQMAVGLLREARLRAEYEEAADEWEASPASREWSATDTDGMSDAAW